jgi:2-polyprenyl-3-methyl-5-hydroxy-6-metoxy-1,4-benzoquinol methylase
VAQNIYDDDGFFAGYATLDRSVRGLAGAAEWPTLQTLLPPLGGRAVVDLGCGYGWFCRWAAGQGAATVRGIDLSEKMLARARSDTNDSRITYDRQDLDSLTLPTASFDLAYSSLVLHYLVGLDRFLAAVHAALRPGGTFVASTEHPLYTAPTDPAFTTAPDGRSIWPLDRYLDEGPRTTDWFAPGVVKQHRTVGTYVNALVQAGLVVTAVVEWGPSPAQVAQVPEWRVERDRPPFLLLAARRD